MQSDDVMPHAFKYTLARERESFHTKCSSNKTNLECDMFI